MAWGLPGKVFIRLLQSTFLGLCGWSSQVTTFLRVVFGVPLLEGYGQTECGAAATLTDANDLSTRRGQGRVVQLRYPR